MALGFKITAIINLEEFILDFERKKALGHQLEISSCIAGLPSPQRRSITLVMTS